MADLGDPPFHDRFDVVGMLDVLEQKGTKLKISFNKPYMTGKELCYINQGDRGDALCRISQ